MRYLKPVALAAVLLGVASGLALWWQHQTVHPSTDDATLQAAIVGIVPQVGGQVAEVAVAENARVRAGDLLFTLDPAVLRVAVDSARAALDQAVLATGASGAEVTAAQAGLAAAEAALAQARQDLSRTEALAQAGDVARAALDQARTASDQAQAARDAAAAALLAAIDRAGAGRAPAVRQARATLAQAELALSHARVTAPADGWVANLTLRPGQVVPPGQPLFSLVEDGTWWVDANFKETDLARIRTGQPVSLSVDMYPGLALTGRVESLGAGSGAVFSLLPPQNATGNWVKVTQRFPVRITPDPLPDGSPVQLRVGASVTATVDTTGAP
ncbi:MAG: HlyD family secretion protein [Rhodobacteraceae bacterium]|jgi:membrane fusion protein (multidrug efflux system)|nr:HlyD family secretion protein [Paracoccaceae bacterium]